MIDGGEIPSRTVSDQMKFMHDDEINTMAPTSPNFA